MLASQPVPQQVSQPSLPSVCQPPPPLLFRHVCPQVCRPPPLTASQTVLRPQPPLACQLAFLQVSGPQHQPVYRRVVLPPSILAYQPVSRYPNPRVYRRV